MSHTAALSGQLGAASAPGAALATATAHNWLILGQSGSGKTRFLRELVLEYKPRARRLLILNTSDELRDLCKHYEYVDNEALERSYSIEGLARLIDQKGRDGGLFLEIAPGDALPKFLDVLGEAVMSLGVKNSDALELVLVYEEAQNWLSKATMRRGTMRVETEGRKFGIAAVKATQVLAATGSDVLSPLAIKQVTRLVVFPLGEANDRLNVAKRYPDLGDPGELAMPNPARNWGPEYLVFDRPRGRVVRVVRDAHGTRRATWTKGAPHEG